MGASRTPCRYTPLTPFGAETYRYDKFSSVAFVPGFDDEGDVRDTTRTQMARPRTEERHHRRAAAGTRRRLRAREEGARDHRDLRPGARRPPVPGGRVGRRQQADVHASRRHGHRGERPRRRGEPHGQADEDPRRAARRAAPEERRHHRGAAREGHRQVRQARRDHRLHRADDESGPHARRQRDLRDQGARRRDLLAAPALEEDVVRDGAADARGARARRARPPTSCSA